MEPPTKSPTLHAGLKNKVKENFIPFPRPPQPRTRDNNSEHTQESQEESTEYSLVFEEGSGIFSWKGEMNERPA